MSAESEAAKQATARFIANALAMANDFKTMRDSYDAMVSERNAAVADAEAAKAAFNEIASQASSADEQLAK